MRLFDVIKYFSFIEKCRVYTNETEEDCVEFEGCITDIPYWLCELELIKDGGIGVEDGMTYFFVEV